MPAIKSCRYCGATGLHWEKRPERRTEQNPNGFALVTDAGQLHQCSGQQQGQQLPGQYETLKRAELVAMVHQRFNPGAEWSPLKMTNAELIAALETGTIPDHIKAQQPTGSGAPAVDIDALLEMLKGEMDERIAAAVRAQTPQTIEVKLPDGTKKVLGRQHVKFPELLEASMLRQHSYLRGPAGSGKSYAAEMIAKALALAYTSISFSPQTGESKLMGYNDANGVYVPGVVYERFKNGGLLLADEMDNANASILAVLNQAAAAEPGQHVSFPSGRDDNGLTYFEAIPRHPDFLIIGTGNTYGLGADAIYVGRQQLDGATLDRFGVIDWDYDERLERELACAYGDFGAWVDYVQRARKAIGKGQRVVISPRASIKGAQRLAAGIDRERVEQHLIWGKIGPDDAAQIRSRMR